jgi:hypothetical protein
VAGIEFDGTGEVGQRVVIAPHQPVGQAAAPGPAPEAF